LLPPVDYFLLFPPVIGHWPFAKANSHCLLLLHFLLGHWPFAQVTTAIACCCHFQLIVTIIFYSWPLLALPSLLWYHHCNPIDCYSFFIFGLLLAMPSLIANATTTTTSSSSYLYFSFLSVTTACHCNNHHLWLIVTLFLVGQCHHSLQPQQLPPPVDCYNFVSHCHCYCNHHSLLPQSPPLLDCYYFFLIVGHLLAMPSLLSTARLHCYFVYLLVICWYHHCLLLSPQPPQVAYF